MSGRALVIAAAASGAGKTTVSAGLLRALERRGVRTRAAKSGPDYIDPGFHAAASGGRGPNLDSWAMPPALLDQLLADAARDADVLLIEGAMGLFDGVPGHRGHSGAVADLAARYGLPVVIVLDVSAQAQTAAAVLRGLATHRRDVRVAAVVLNRVASERHRDLVVEAMEGLDIPLVGSLARDPALEWPSRHLGLVQAGEHADLQARLDALAAWIERQIDLDRLLALARPLELPSARAAPALPPPGTRIALASDAAFTFVYPHLLAAWRGAGAEIATFSPLADEPPPESCDSCWLPGGYPELHAARLAAALRFRDGLRRFARSRPVHGECGGYMVLGESIEDAQGVRHVMAGLLGHATSFAKRKLHLGYRHARLLADGPLGATGETIRGHEYHHATITSLGEGDERLVDVTDAQGRPVAETGSRRGRVSGTFFHAIAREG